MTVHLLFGAVIGKYIESWWLIIILALISHHILDAIPHYKMTPVPNYKEKGLKGTKFKDILTRSIEPLFGIILTLVLIFYNKEKMIPMLVGSFLAWSPDIINFLGWKYKKWEIIRKLVPYPGHLFYNEAKSKIVGIGISVVISIVLIILLLK
jgi:hypothetical protein